MTDVRFRDIMKAWVKQGIKHSPLEKRSKHLNKFVKSKKLASWKEDLKWALQADLDEPVAPHPKQQPDENDENVTHSPAHPHPVANRHSKRPAKSAEAKTIDININFDSMPRFKKPDVSWAKRLFRSRKFIIISGTLCVVAIGVIAGVRYVPQLNKGVAFGNSSHPAPGTPTYGTVLPSGKSIADLGGWSRVSPPNRDPVYAFTDKVDSVSVIVSQQPLPDDFKSDPDGSIEKLAKGFHADTKVEADGTTAFLGTSAKGPQSVIFKKDDLLILIKSDSKIDTAKWSHYISSLK